MRKLTITGLAIALALALNLGTPRPAAAQTVSQKVASCNAKMEAQYAKTKPHVIFLVAAKKLCIETKGDDRAAIFLVNNFKQPVDAATKKAINAYNARFDNPQGIEEPGMVGMAETLLREKIRGEAQALLPALAAEKERIRLAALTEQERLAEEAAKAKANDPVYQAKKTKYDECMARNAAAVPDPQTGAITVEFCTNPDQVTGVLSTPGTSTGIVITGPTNKCGPKTTPSGPAEIYEETLINMICKNPDAWNGIKIWLYLTLKRIAGPTGAKTPGEKEFLANMVNFVRDQNIKVAQGAIDAYEVWKRKKSYKPPTIGTASVYYLGEIPPDFNALATQQILAGAAAAAVVGAIGASVAAGVVIASSSSSLAFLMGGAVATGVSSGLFVAAAATGPVVIAVAALAIAGYGAYTIIKIDEARPKLDKALAEAEKQPNLGRLMNAPDTVALVQYYFAKATSKYSPTGLKDDNKGCQACFFEHSQFGGRKFCTSGRENNLKDRKVEGDSNFHWGDKITSVQLDTARCTGGYVKLFEDDRMRGEKLNLTRTVSNIGSTWNDRVSSLEFIDRNAPQCEVCIYEDRLYAGGYFCTSSPVSDLRSIGWSDEASSLILNIRSCPKAKVWLFEDENYTGKFVELSQSNQDFKKLDNRRKWGRKEWDNEVTSMFFSRTGKNPYVDRQIGGCRVCLYDHTHYNGRWACADGGTSIAKLGADEHGLNDQATSIDFQTTECPKGKSIIATLYDKDNYKGSELYMEESDRNFGGLSRGRSIWNDSVSSIKVKLVDTSSLECRICLYEAINYKGKKYCTDGLKNNLSDVDFNDITSSIKVFRQKGKIGTGKTCLGGGAWVFKNKNKGGEKWNIKLDHANIPNVGSKWNDKISSVEYSSTKYNVVDSSMPKAVGPDLWKSSGYEALDISAGPDGLVWIIGSDNKPKVWDGKRWSQRGSQKGTRIDAGPHGTAWMVGTDKFLYTWKGDAWNRAGFRKATDVGVGPNGTVWIVSGDKSDKRARPFGGNKNKPDHFKIYRWNGSRWFKVDQYAMRIDVDPRGHAWIVTHDKNGPYSYTRFVPRVPVRGAPPPPYGGRTQWDVSIGANGKVVLAADAPWVLKGRKWDRVHGRYFAAISVDRNGDLWGISTHKTGKMRIFFYGNALKNIVNAPAAAAPKVVVGKEWKRVAGGKALDISVGPGGITWAIGADKSLYTWNGKGWTKRNEKTRNNQAVKGTRIDVGPGGKPWMVGTDKFPYAFNGRVWEQMGNKTVSDVGVGADGTVWAVGTNPKIPLKWRGTNWRRRTGVNDTVLRIDVGPKGEGWVVTQRGKVFKRSESGGGWRVKEFNASYGKRPRPVPANDISIGADGTAMIAVKAGGIAVWDEKKSEWTKSGPNQVKPVSVAAAANAKGAPWVSLANKDIWSIKDVYRSQSSTPQTVAENTVVQTKPAAPPRAAAKKWKRTTNGLALDISAGPDGSLWVIGTNNSPYIWTGKKWTKITGKGTRIDVGNKGWAWLVGTDGYGYHWRSNKWNKIGGKKISDVAIGGKKAWAIGTDRKAGGHSIYRFTGQWTAKGGAAVRIDVGPKGNPWVVNDKGQVLRWSGKGWVNTAAIAMAAARKAGPYAPKFPPYLPATDISVGANGKVWIALKGGGTAVWTGFGWAPGGLNAKTVSVAVDKSGIPWITIANKQIWAMR